MPHNLPAAVTSFIGREREITTLARLLGEVPQTTRLLTLTGAGGVGKTRLALEVAAELLRGTTFPDGVWLVELASLADPRRLAQVVSAVFGLQEEPGRGYAEVLVDALRPRRLALLLDNGYSNQSIAETLVVGRRTAEMHVSNLLSKLGFVSRAQLAVRAVEHGLLEEAPV
jgi:DNA-binding NarL/FixJ family response regulator